VPMINAEPSSPESGIPDVAGRTVLVGFTANQACSVFATLLRAVSSSRYGLWNPPMAEPADPRAVRLR